MSANVSHKAQPLGSQTRYITAKYIYDGEHLQENAILVIDDGKIKEIMSRQDWENKILAEDMSPSEIGESAVHS